MYRAFLSSFFSAALCVIAFGLLLLGAVPASANLGGDFIIPYEQEVFDCLKTQGNWSFVIIRCYRSIGAPDANAPMMLERAKKAGFTRRDVYHFPCMGKVSVAAQMADALAPIRGEFDTMWLDVETNPSAGCEWSETNFTQNCEFLTALIREGERLGIKLGVYASIYMWGLYLGESCTVASHLPLWYPRYNRNLDFNDFTPFGGWMKPYGKQYTNSDKTCGGHADGNWFPNL